MQIHYIWIKEFNAIKEAGVNLSSKFLIHMDESFSLIIRDNPDYIDHFFKEKNVTDVSAIIGKNGTGKSSVLKYIKDNFPDGLNSRIQHDIIVYSSDEKYFVSCPESMTIELKNSTDCDFKMKKYKKVRSSDGLVNAEYIYYNYLLDYNEDSTNWHGLKNISTTAMLLKERTRILGEINQPLEFTRKQLAETSELQRLHMIEVYQAVVFITRTEQELPFEKPKSLHIMLDVSEQDYFLEEGGKNQNVPSMLKKLNGIIPKYKSTSEAFIGNLWYSVFINYLIAERKYTANNPYFHGIDFEKSDSRDSYITRFFGSMLGVTFPYESDGKIHHVRIEKLDNLSVHVPLFITLITELIEGNIITVKNEREAYFNLNKGADADFKEFQNLYTAIKGITSFIQFRWHSLSSGEQSYLSLMSRFYSLVHEQTDRMRNGIVILIDEGDTGYHPEWQRKFFKNTIRFLSSLFHGHKIQLIFTSNAPFLTSDLPKSNILFVEKSADGKPFFLEKDNHNANTFAANIHTLFSDSFYMDGMLIGEYAKDKINEVIKYLNDETVVQSNDNYKKIIDSIGEPVLRKKLQDMWFEKFGLQEKLEVLKRQVAEVEQIIKENNGKSSL
ncbi:AAA family ATPase [Flavobacterium sp. GA093]|uniref:AAA family ATPase n=1 Tax=Flavobacterium hydrocarbonoxydans TaxID=2683249 RepID=A0A6I4NSG5_9FLAO|nr:AAA family ATPase [Flavobacterium hydrocarbonoxydans]MWB94027.1 AAA family ATPase [Flavobacterium hydrocarbonoxydans]